MREVETQFAVAHSADFEEMTWTFLMPESFTPYPGQFAIVDKPVYERMLKELEFFRAEDQKLCYELLQHNTFRG